MGKSIALETGRLEFESGSALSASLCHFLNLSEFQFLYWLHRLDNTYLVGLMWKSDVIPPVENTVSGT